MRRSSVVVFSFAAVLAAQEPGVLPEWHVREAAAKLGKHAAAVDGLLAQLKPQEWAAQGGPKLYIEQVQQTRQFNSYLTAQAEALEREPGKLSVALDTFLRLDHLQSLLESIAAGARQYQNPALADLMAAAISQNTTTRELLKEYARQLAVEREKEWEIANREAQRCRAFLSKQPPSPPARKAAPAKP